jgi:hypothetical protein
MCSLQVHFVGYIYVCKIFYTFWVCVYKMLGILITVPSCFLFVTLMVCVFCVKSVLCIARLFYWGHSACKDQNC